jgi:2-hydroxychromene-2-carboxylate isomerase
MEAIKIAYVALQESWGRAYIQNSYREWIEQGNPIGEEPNISNSLNTLTQDPKAVLEEASNEQTQEGLLAETDVARKLRIFGSPTFVVGDEIFWGDDRLEDAVFWANKS